MKLPPAPVGTPFGSYTWADWYQKIRFIINDSQIDHNSLQNIQGGSTTERYHLTAAQVAAIGTSMQIKQIVRGVITIGAGATLANYTLGTPVNMSKTLLSFNGWSGFLFAGTFPAGDCPYVKLTSTTNVQAFRQNNPAYSCDVAFELVEYT